MLLIHDLILGRPGCVSNTRYRNISHYPYMAKPGKPGHAVVVARDITDRKKAEDVELSPLVFVVALRPWVFSHCPPILILVRRRRRCGGFGELRLVNGHVLLEFFHLDGEAPSRPRQRPAVG